METPDNSPQTTTRKMTVCCFYKDFPTIRLRGKWLKDAGFESGQIVTITCRDRELIIATDGTRKHPLKDEK